MTPQLKEEEEDFVQETPEAALIAAQAYLLGISIFVPSGR
jgi:hypothetical protein